jgi:hypothetical protein
LLLLESACWRQEKKVNLTPLAFLKNQWQLAPIERKIQPMKRARRWSFNGLALISLVFCIALILLWARGFWVQDYVSWLKINGRQSEHIEATNAQGRLQLQVAYLEMSPLVEPKDKNGTSIDWWDLPSYPNLALTTYHYTIKPSIAIGFWGFQFVRADSRDWEASQLRDYSITLPMPFILLCTGVCPAIWAWKSFRRTEKPGYCSKCGYDLRATPNLCPECGTVPKKVITAA